MTFLCARFVAILSCFTTNAFQSPINNVQGTAHKLCHLERPTASASSLSIFQRHPRIKLAAANSDSDNENSSLQEALKRSQERSLDHFIEAEAPAWLSNLKTENAEAGLPFSCTACGKCCRTVGEVYLAPEDIQQAAQILDTAPFDFVYKYASHYLTSAPNASASSIEKLLDDNDLWVRLKEGDKATCVFLDDETNYCRIYEARPTQCRTYPFWPNIMRSPEQWNDECRKADDVADINESDGNSLSKLPFWTAEAGGCEGMRLLEQNSVEKEETVPLREAGRQLLEYKLTDTRFPHSSNEISLTTD